MVAGLCVVGVRHGQQVEPAVAVEVPYLHVVDVLAPRSQVGVALGMQAVRSAVEHAQPVAGGAHQVGMTVLIEVGDDVGVAAAGGQLEAPCRVEAPARPARVDVHRELPDRSATGRPWC